MFVTGLAKNAEATGEVRVIAKRTAAFLRWEHLAGDRFDIPSLELAKQRMEQYNSNRCLWMHRHTNLRVEVIKRIGDFVSPPPVFYLEEGDLVLDLDWGPFLHNAILQFNTNNYHRIYEDDFQVYDELTHPTRILTSNATIVARPRQNPVGIS